MQYILVVSLTAAILITVAIIDSSLEGQETAPSQVAVIYKNQIHPTIAQLEARAANAERGNEVISNEGVVVQRRSQWI
jgi:hypothetical protein